MDHAHAELLRLPDGRAAQLWVGGAADGPAVFFFHGCPDTRHAAMTGDAAARRAGVRLVAVNRPGYGQSDPHASGHASVADDTIAVADLLGVGRFAVLGMSIGGQYALTCAARHPGRVTAAGVVAAPAVVPELTPPWHRDDLDDAGAGFIARLASLSAEEAAERMRPDFESWVAGLNPMDQDDLALVNRWSETLPPADADLLHGHSTEQIASSVREALLCSDGYLRDASAAFRPWEVRPEGVSCPTWLWYGELDDNAPVRNGQWLAEHVRGSRLIVRQGTTHLATLVDHWEDILTTLRSAANRTYPPMATDSRND